jgi:putative Mn2+ efflux pump MntP
MQWAPFDRQNAPSLQASLVGRVLGDVAGRWAEAVGGLLLIAIGSATLQEHLLAVA